MENKAITPDDVIRELRAVVEFYAKKQNWAPVPDHHMGFLTFDSSLIELDAGKVAREALAIHKRECFGDYMGPTCQGHNGCPHELECSIDRNLRGPCDCPYKKSCHIPRQSLQARLYQELPAHLCSFIAMFEGKVKL